MLHLPLSCSLTQMEAQSSSALLLSRKRRREGSNGETEEGERLGKIPRCTVVSQLCASVVIEQHFLHTLAIYIRLYMYVIYQLKGERLELNVLQYIIMFFL